MLAFLRRNVKSIINLYLLLFGLFGGVAVIGGLILYFDEAAKIILPIILYTGLGAAIITIVLCFFEAIRIYQETNFFKKQPYNFIQKNLLENQFIRNSRFWFYRKHRVFLLDEVKYEVVFYSDILNEHGNTVHFCKQTEEGLILHIIDYKKERHNEFSLLRELRNIK